MSYIFISHSSLDKQTIIRDFVRILVYFEIPIWIDRPFKRTDGFGFSKNYVSEKKIGHIEHSKSWADSITEAIRNSSAALFCLTENFYAGTTNQLPQDNIVSKFDPDRIISQELLLGEFQKKSIYCMLTPFEHLKIKNNYGLINPQEKQWHEIDKSALPFIAEQLEKDTPEAIKTSEYSEVYELILILINELRAVLEAPPYIGPSIHSSIAKLTNTPPNTANPFSFERQISRFQGREAEFERLNIFLNSQGEIKWQLLLGESGLGKSRFSQEFCQNAQRQGWTSGFITPLELRSYNWAGWVPNRDTLIVVDAPDETTAQYLNQAILSMCGKSNSNKVRFLILERRIDGIWYENYLPDNKPGTEILKDLEYDTPLILDELSYAQWIELVWDAYSALTTNRSTTKSDFLELLKKRQYRAKELRPISALFLGAYLSDLSDQTQRQESTLDPESAYLAQFITQEFERLKVEFEEAELEEVTKLTAIATITGKSSTHEQNRTFPFSRKKVQKLTPIQPNVLGEYFVLNYVEKLDNINTRELIEHCWDKSPHKTRQFIIHAFEDYPASAAIQRILQIRLTPTNSNYEAWLMFGLDLLKSFPDEEFFWDLHNELRYHVENDPTNEKPSTRLLSKWIARAPSFMIALSIFQDYCLHNDIVEIEIFNALLAKSPPEYCEILWQNISDHKLQIDDITCRMIIRATAPAVIVERIRNLEEQLGTQISRTAYKEAFDVVDELNFDKLFSVFANSRLKFSHSIVHSIITTLPADKAIAKLDIIRDSGFHMRQSDINRCLFGLLHTHYEKAKLEITKFVNLGYPPSIDVLTKALSLAPNQSEYENILNLMDDLSIIKDKYIFNIMIRRASSQQRLVLYDDLISQNIEPDAHIFNTLILCSNSFEEGVGWIQAMSAAKVTPDEFHFTPLAKLCQRHQWLEFSTLRNSHNIHYDERLANTILLKFWNSLTNAELEEMLADVSNSSEVASSGFYSLWLRNLPNTASIDNHLDNFFDLGLEIDEYITAALCNLATSFENAIELAEEFFEENDIYPYVVLESLFASAIKHEASFDKLEPFFDILVENFDRLPVKQMEHVIVGATPEQARKIVEGFLELGVNIPKKIYDTATRLIDKIDPQYADQLFEMYAFKEHTPHPGTITSIIKSRNFFAGFQLIESMKTNHESLDERILNSLAWSVSTPSECQQFIKLVESLGAHYPLNNTDFYAMCYSLSFKEHLECIYLAKKAKMLINATNWKLIINKASNENLRDLLKVKNRKFVKTLIFNKIIETSSSKSTEAVLEEMRQKRINPDIYTFASCISRSTSFKAAYAYFRTAARLKNFVNFTLFEKMLVHIEGRKQMWLVLGTIINEKIQIEQKTYSELEAILPSYYSEEKILSTLNRLQANIEFEG